MPSCTSDSAVRDIGLPAPRSHTADHAGNRGVTQHNRRTADRRAVLFRRDCNRTVVRNQRDDAGVRRYLIRFVNCYETLDSKASNGREYNALAVERITGERDAVNRIAGVHSGARLDALCVRMPPPGAPLRRTAGLVPDTDASGATGDVVAGISSAPKNAQCGSFIRIQYQPPRRYSITSRGFPIRYGDTISRAVCRVSMWR